MMKSEEKRHIGFTIEEEMSGTHHFVNGFGPPGNFPFSFKLKWGADRVRDFLNPTDKRDFLTASYTGKVYMGRFVTNADCEGTLELRYFSEGKIRYCFTFKQNGNKYRYVGEKINIRPWNLHRTHTTCYGTVYDAETGEEISKSVTHFRLRTLPKFLRSLKLILSN